MDQQLQAAQHGGADGGVSVAGTQPDGDAGTQNLDDARRAAAVRHKRGVAERNVRRHGYDAIG